jgi:hypothetical protein
LRGVAAMNGIDLESVDRFWDKWQLVDVRYRKDNGEQRFVYANEVAWKAMSQHQTNYPDGAMFGKVAFRGDVDPAFPASIEPSEFTRLQIMKHDAKAYNDTDGWGYAVVTTSYNGSSTPAEDIQAAGACHACHRLVPDRGFVFSSSPFLPGTGDRQMASRLRFQAAAVKELDANQQKILTRFAGKKPEDMVRYLPMTLFIGSVDEASAVLARYATEDHATYFLSDPRSGHFVVADGVQLSPSCQPGTRVLQSRNADAPGLVPDSYFTKTLCGDLLTIGRIDKLDPVPAPKASH